MRILEWKVPSSFELVLFGDNQEGNALQSRHDYQGCIDYMRSGKNIFGLHMGDEQEAYWIDDPRYDPVILTKTPLEQQEQVITDLGPLAKAKSLIGILYGNHTDRLAYKVGDITAMTCKRLGVNYGGFACAVSFVDKHGPQFKGYFTHGRKMIGSVADDPIRRLANEKLQLKRQLECKAGDCLIMAKGHTHKLIISEPLPQLYITADLIDGNKKIKQHYTTNQPFGKGGYVHPDHRWYCNTGSFLRTFGVDVNSYSEKAEYDPVELGYIVVEVNDRVITNVRKVIV